MIRTLLTTSAIALALSTAAMAQTTTTNEMAPAANEMAPATNPMAPADNTMAPADNSMAPADNTMAPADTTTTTTTAPATDNAMSATRTPMDMAAGYTVANGDAIVSEVMGATIYSTAGEDAEEIGKVNDLVISSDGQIHAVVIGVGGFLGIGEKNVAIDFSQLQHEMAHDNTWRWVLGTTKEALEAAPEFVWKDPNAPAETTAPAAGTDTMAPAAPAAPATN